MRALALICFLASGASGLIFQVIWSRTFSLVFGTTTLAISTVVAAFMAGLALGSFLAGKLADRIKDPLRAYALAELGVGLLALALPAIISSFDSLNSWAYQQFPGNFAVISLIRFVASAAVILLPTTMMGATLPLLSRYFVQTKSEHNRVGGRVGSLYAINTLGAVLGTFFGGFVLLPQLGLNATNRLAAMTNIALAAAVGLAYLVRRRHARQAAELAQYEHDDAELDALLSDVQSPAAQPIPISPRTRRAAIIAFGFSGASAMIYQVVWSRALAMNIGSSVYSFTIVLVTFLVGLAGGAAIVGRMSQRSQNPVGWLAMVHLTIAVSVALSHLLIDQLPYVYLFLSDGGRMQADAVLWRQFLLTALTILPATLAMGGVFPLTIRVVSSGLDRVGRDVGNAYSINTIGAIAGSFLAGFVVIPLLQMQPGIYLAACINLAIAAVMAALARWPRRLQLTLASIASCGIAFGPLLPGWNPYTLSVGLFRPTVARQAMAAGGKWHTPDLVFYRDGLSTTVTVEQWSAKHFSLKNNGKVDASTGDDMPTQIAVGLLPILLHPDVPRITPKVALIGLASGVTAGAALQYPLDTLHVIELEPAIIEASRFFEHVNNRPLQDPRVRMITDDGRNFLQATNKRFDVIINEPSNPWLTGVSNLFTKQYFQVAKSRLRKGGVFCTWAQMYELAPRRIKSIYRAFTEVFPYVYAFSATTLSSDTFLLGSERPLTIDLQRLERVYAIASVNQEMARAKIPTPHDLMALALLGPEGARAFVVGAEANTDDNAIVEFAAPRDLYNHKRYDYYISKVYGYGWAYGRLDDLIKGYKSSHDYARLVRALLVQGRVREATYFLGRVTRKSGGPSLLAHQLMEQIEPPDGLEGDFSLQGQGPKLEGPKPPKWVKEADRKRVAKDFPRIRQLWTSGECKDALALIEKWSEDAREYAGKDFHLTWGYMAYKCSQPRAAVAILEPLVKDERFRKRRPIISFLFARAAFSNADFAKSVRAFERWIRLRRRQKKPLLEKTGVRAFP
jgi:spermidine synthase